MALSEEIHAQFLRDNPPRRLMVNSIPKSGTTWMRTMLAALPGYEEFPRKGVDGTKPEQLLALEPGQVFHAHMLMNKKLMEIVEERDIKAVYIYRDLRDAVVSDYFHRADLNPKRAPEFFKGKSQDELLRASNLLRWCGPARRYPDVRHWLNQDQIPVVRYEALKTDAVQEMARILDAMGFSASEEVVRHVVDAGSFETMTSGRSPGQEDRKSGRRKGVVGDWRNHFTAEHINEFKDEFGSLLIEYGYESGPDWRA